MTSPDLQAEARRAILDTTAALAHRVDQAVRENRTSEAEAISACIASLCAGLGDLVGAEAEEAEMEKGV